MGLDRWAEEHFDYLRKLGFSEKQIDVLRTDNELEIPEYDMSHFMRLSWRDVIDPHMHKSWLNDVYKMLRGENFDHPRNQLCFYDESEWDDLKSAVETLLEANIDQQCLLKLIRACQKNILGSMFQLLDGGTGGDYHLYEIEYKDGELCPRRSFTNMEDYFMDYDPIKILPTIEEK